MLVLYFNFVFFECVYGVGDGYCELMFLFNVLVCLNGCLSFGIELFFFMFYLGSVFVDNIFFVNLGLNFYGNFCIEYGSFGICVGGIYWYNLSFFIIGVF